jgi:hypothetical protein
MVAAAYLDGDSQAKPSAQVGSSEGGATAADTVVAFCLKYCLHSPVDVAAADMTASVAVSIWEWFRLPVRCPEKDAFGDLRQVCSLR